jgi:signal transduction histidine kinase
MRTRKSEKFHKFLKSVRWLFERFKRGDQSRHTEGSGLGLAIAKSIMELQGGRLAIELDGDLFKVIVEFQKA